MIHEFTSISYVHWKYWQSLLKLMPMLVGPYFSSEVAGRLGGPIGPTINSKTVSGPSLYFALRFVNQFAFAGSSSEQLVFPGDYRSFH